MGYIYIVRDDNGRKEQGGKVKTHRQQNEVTLWEMKMGNREELIIQTIGLVGESGKSDL